jgi:Ca2+-binding RTX toxin-like protein
MNNMGEISGIMAVVVGANEGNPDQKVMDFTNEVINHKHGVIMGANAGIYFVGSGEQTLVNAGLIAGDMAVTTSASGSLHMVNTGRMEGNIILNSGSDVVDTRTGIIHGQIAGGGGNDVYLIGKSPVSIVEVDGAGYDTVNSNASYTLADNVEKLVGLGTGNIALFGNSSDNIIQGKKGHNNISGMGGADQLSGGRGDDHLTGGTDADTFIFYKGDGKDTVGDFENGADKIMLFNVPGADSFADLEPHIKQHGSDVWFDFGADRLVLTGMKVADIDATDFNF